ncbi:MAG: hypothetical protein AAGJ35_15035, partial [Myxococcota bacterium]
VEASCPDGEPGFVRKEKDGSYVALCHDMCREKVGSTLREYLKRKDKAKHQARLEKQKEQRQQRKLKTPSPPRYRTTTNNTNEEQGETKQQQGKSTLARSNLTPQFEEKTNNMNMRIDEIRIQRIVNGFLAQEQLLKKNLESRTEPYSVDCTPENKGVSSSPSDEFWVYSSDWSECGACQRQTLSKNEQVPDLEPPDCTSEGRVVPPSTSDESSVDSSNWSECGTRACQRQISWGNEENALDLEPHEFEMLLYTVPM